MSCMKQATTCLEIIIIRLELPSNLTLPYAFAFRVLVYFLSHVNHFLKVKFYKIIRKALAIEYFLSKVAELQPKI